MSLGAVSSGATVERNVAGSRFRYATPAWYQLSMGLLKNWPVAAKASVNVDGHALDARLLRMPTADEPIGSERGRGFALQAQKAGWGIVMLARPEPATLVLTKSASDAAKLTARDEQSYVLSEPPTGWSESARLMALAGGSVAVAVGALLSYQLANRLRRRTRR